jgi:hypothetical protein
VSETPLLHVMFSSLRATARLIGAGADANRVLELDGVTAVIVPSTPDRSVVNSVVYEHAELLEAALGTLADAYHDAGVRAWTVWTRDGDERAVNALESAGHKLDALPQAMGFALSELRGPPGPEPEWSGEWDLDGRGDQRPRLWGSPRDYGRPLWPGFRKALRTSTSPGGTANRPRWCWCTITTATAPSGSRPPCPRRNGGGSPAGCYTGR